MSLIRYNYNELLKSINIDKIVGLSVQTAGGPWTNLEGFLMLKTHRVSKFLVSKYLVTMLNIFNNISVRLPEYLSPPSIFTWGLIF